MARKKEWGRFNHKHTAKGVGWRHPGRTDRPAWSSKEGKSLSSPQVVASVQTRGSPKLTITKNSEADK